jgi:hypothetical protein
MMFSAMTNGFRHLWHTKRLVLVYYLANLVLALAAAYPLTRAFSSFAGHSLMAKKLALGFDFDLLFEFLHENAGALSAFTGIFLGALALYILLGLFFSGGALSTFIAGGRYSPALFWGNAAQYFGRFFRLALWSVPAFIVFFALQFVVPLLVRLFFGKTPYEYITVWGAFARIVVATIGFMLYVLVLDYARIYAIANGERRMRKALWKGVTFTFGNFFRTFGLTLAVFLMGLVLLVVYNVLADLLRAPNGFVLFMLVVVQQLTMASRMYLRLTLLAAQTHLYGMLLPREEPQGPAPHPDQGPAPAAAF